MRHCHIMRINGSQSHQKQTHCVAECHRNQGRKKHKLPTHAQVKAHKKMGLGTHTIASQIKFGIHTGHLIKQDTQVIVNPADFCKTKVELPKP